MRRTLPLLLVAGLLCWAVDGTDAALGLEATLAGRMACALRALLRGLCLADAPHVAIAPACSGLRTAVAAGLFGAFTARRWWVGAPCGALAGLALNLLRLLAIELAMRLEPALGQTLHDLALPLLIAPLALLLCAALRTAGTVGRAALACLAAALALPFAAAHVSTTTFLTPDAASGEAVWAAADPLFEAAAANPLHPYHALWEAHHAR